AAIGGLQHALLGFGKGFACASLDRLPNRGIAGLVNNVVNGLLFFVGKPLFYDWNPLFHLQMASIVLGGGTLVVFNCTSAFRSWARLGSGEEPPAVAKFIAASSLMLWLVIIVLGRYLPLTQESLRVGP